MPTKHCPSTAAKVAKCCNFDEAVERGQDIERKGAASSQREIHSLRLRPSLLKITPVRSNVCHLTKRRAQIKQNIIPNLPLLLRNHPHLPTKTDTRPKDRKRHARTMQPANIVHQDGFEVTLTHLSKRLTIYDSLDPTTDLLPSAAGNVEHAGNFAGFSNKVYVVPEQSDGDRSIAIHLRLLPLFDFFSANAVRAGLCIVDSKGGITFSKDRIIYKRRQRRRPA